MITAHLATIPGREQSLRKTVDSLLPQVDWIYIALNGHTEVPETLKGVERLTMAFMDNSLGDAAKFSFLDMVDGYVLICDDDLVYPPSFAAIMQDKVVLHGCPVSFHGKSYAKRPIESFRKDHTSNHRCLCSVVGDHEVDIIGTGTLAFRVGDIKLSIADFPYPNMADIWFSKLAHEQGIKLIAVEHPRGILRYIKPETTIWRNMSDGVKETEVINTFLK